MLFCSNPISRDIFEVYSVAKSILLFFLIIDLAAFSPEIIAVVIPIPQFSINPAASPA